MHFLLLFFMLAEVYNFKISHNHHFLDVTSGDTEIHFNIYMGQILSGTA